jgi:hypothetical protein
MFSWVKLLKKPPAENWRLVKTVTESNATYDNKTLVVYLHLFESDRGNRRVEAASTITVPDLDNQIKKLAIYQSIVFPWLHGRVNPEIPRYSEIPEEETVAMLRGKVI